MGADRWLANSRLRAVVRHPQASLTLAGLGGGTLVDLAPWGLADGLLEAAPLVDEGWLVVEAEAQEADALRLGGTVRALPDRLHTPEGARREVRWRVPVDEPWLALEGADGLWLHPDGEATLLGDWLLVGSVVYGHDGQLDEDLGGALRLRGVGRLLAAPVGEAWKAGLVPTRVVAGSAPEASLVRASAGDRLLALLAVAEDGRFEGPVPEAVDTLRALANGRAPSAAVPASQDAVLTLGAAGAVRLRVGWEDGLSPHPIRVRWDGGEARTGERRLAPDGDLIELGEGRVRLTVSAGPDVRPQVVDVVIGPEAVEELAVLLRPRLARDTWVPADLAFPAARARTVRASPAGRLRSAVAQGLEYVVALADDDVGSSVAFLNDLPFVRWEDGAVLHHPAGWTVATWPLAADSGEAGGGVPRIVDLGPEDALRAATGGSRDRWGRVDLAWLHAAGRDPRVLDPLPDFVTLEAPGPELAAWTPWIALLDAGRFVRPSGPLLWLQVDDAAGHGRIELERALRRGRLVAGTGGWLSLDVDGAGPGEVVPEDIVAPRAAVRAQRGDLPLDRLALLGPGGIRVAEVALVDDDQAWAPDVDLPAWVAAVAWSSTTDDWVVTMPAWVDPPFLPRTEPDDTAESP